MILYFDGNGKICAYKAEISEKDAKREEACGVGVFYDGEFDFFMGENKPGFEKVFYLNEDGTIRIEYEEIPPEIPEPTQLDRIEAAISQSNTYLSQTYSEIENRIIDNYTMSLVENNII